MLKKKKNELFFLFFFKLTRTAILGRIFYLCFTIEKTEAQKAARNEKTEAQNAATELHQNLTGTCRSLSQVENHQKTVSTTKNHCT